MRDELDRILDEAIKSYAAIEPPPALPARILRQAQQELAPRHNRWRLALAIALPLAAALALGVVLLSQWTLPEPPASVTSAPATPIIAEQAHPQPAKTIAVATREPLPAHRRIRETANRSSWARPLPLPYSKEELALLHFVQQHPKEAAAIAEAQKHGLANPAPEPITIVPLHTEPLTIAALN